MFKEFKYNYKNFTEISQELIDELLATQTLKDYYFDESKWIDHDVLEAFGSEYPSFMDIQRPNESEKQKAYRKDYFEKVGNPILGFLGQIEKQIDKTFNSSEWKINYSLNSRLGKDSAKEYLTNGYYNGRNMFTSFREMVKTKTLVNPNSIMVVIPNDVKDDYPMPYYLIVEPERVKYFKANELCVIESELLNDVVDEYGNIEPRSGKTYYIFDKKRYIVLKHTKNENGQPVYSTNKVGNEFRLHGCDFLPAWKIGRKVIEQTEDGHELRTSDLQDSLVFLKNAIMNYMDLIVEYNFHVASQEWTVGTVDCISCRGTGTVKGDKKPMPCGSCGGGGKMPTLNGNGLDKVILPYASNELGGKSEKMPLVAGGFIQRPETGAKLFKESFERNMQYALQPFGLEHLMKVPLNQSGLSKDYDMQEGYAFVQSMSQHIESMLSKTITAIVCMRYKKLGKEEIANEIPVLVMPKSFNLSSAETLTIKLRDAETYGLPDFLKLKYAGELLDKEAGSNSDEVLYFKARKKLDPMPASNFNQKSISRNMLSDLKYILTTNIDAILIEAIELNIGFLNMEYAEQKTIVNEIATRYLEEVGDNINENIVIKPAANVVGENQTN